jgi:hypothetical protein
MRIRTLFLSLLIAAPMLADMYVPQAGATKLIIPVAGNAAGANGTYFRSDISVSNLRNISQKVAIYWLPQGGSGTVVTPLRVFDVPANRGFSSEDFVDSVIDRTGLGAIEVVGVQGDGVTLDPDARLHVTSRIWTPRPDGGAGTMSQPFPAIVAGATPLTNAKAIFGLRRGSQFRLNVGVYNPSSQNQRFHVQVSISGTSGTDVVNLDIDVLPRSMQQVLVPGTSTGIVQMIVEDLEGGAGDWQTWGSSNDNQSGDAWSQMGFPIQ